MSKGYPKHYKVSLQLMEQLLEYINNSSSTLSTKKIISMVDNLRRVELEYENVEEEIQEENTAEEPKRRGRKPPVT